MGIFDYDEVITAYSLKHAVEDGVLVEIFKKRWSQLSGGKPIVAARNLFENVSLAGLRDIWNEFAHWKRHVEATLPGAERLFATKMNGLTVWVIEDGVAYTLMYPGGLLRARCPGAAWRLGGVGRIDWHRRVWREREEGGSCWGQFPHFEPRCLHGARFWGRLALARE